MESNHSKRAIESLRSEINLALINEVFHPSVDIGKLNWTSLEPRKMEMSSFNLRSPFSISNARSQYYQPVHP